MLYTVVVAVVVAVDRVTVAGLVVAVWRAGVGVCAQVAAACVTWVVRVAGTRDKSVTQIRGAVCTIAELPAGGDVYNGTGPQNDHTLKI